MMRARTDVETGPMSLDDDANTLGDELQQVLLHVLHEVLDGTFRSERFAAELAKSHPLDSFLWPCHFLDTADDSSLQRGSGGNIRFQLRERSVALTAGSSASTLQVTAHARLHRREQ